MNKVAALLVCLMLLLPVILAKPASAADEDTQASVYLVFDEETGEFVTVDDVGAASQYKAQQDQEAIDSVIETADNSNESPLTWLVGAALILIVLGAATWSMRNRRRAS